MSAGGPRKAAPTAVRRLIFLSDNLTDNSLYITGRRRTREVVVKEEPKSPGNGGSRKRKMYSTTDSTPIGTIDPPDIDFTPPQPDGKRQRVAAKATSRVRFDGVAVPNKPPAATRATRKSTRATKPNTKELFVRLGQELQNVVKTVEEIAEALD